MKAVIKLGEISFLSGNVRKLANFYKVILGIDNGSEDDSFQELISGDVCLTIYNDGDVKPNNNQNMCLVFDVGDVDAEYERLTSLEEFKLHFIKKPYDGPQDRRFMAFYDIDGNRIYFRNNGEKA